MGRQQQVQVQRWRPEEQQQVGSWRPQGRYSTKLSLQQRQQQPLEPLGSLEELGCWQELGSSSSGCWWGLVLR